LEIEFRDLRSDRRSTAPKPSSGRQQHYTEEEADAKMSRRFMSINLAKPIDPKPCGFAAALGRRRRVAHNSTGPTTATID
jgi:hypothetical protein